MSNYILKAFNAAHLADSYNPDKHRIVVRLDGRIVAQISPTRGAYLNRLYTVPAGVPIGNIVNIDQLRRAILRVVFKGDAAAMARATVERVLR